MIRQERRRRFERICISALFVFLASANASVAASITTVDDIRAATKFAVEKGWCTTKDQTKANCTKRQTICDNEKWSSFVEGSIEFRNGAPFPKEVAPTPIGYGTMVLPSQTMTASIPEGVYEYLRKDPRNRLRIDPFTEASCFCECNPDETDILCKGKSPGAPVHVGGDELFTREECRAECTRKDRNTASLCAGSLASIERAEGEVTRAPSAANIQALCFTTDQCAKQFGDWEAWDKCKDGKGRCAAREPEITLNVAIGDVREIQGLNTYIVTAFRYIVSIVAIATTVMFIYGAFQYLVGSAIETISRGKQIMIDAIVGMILVIGSVTILRTLNPDLLTLNPIKVYMVNTVQFIEAAYCSELDESLKLADAGEYPNLKSYDELSSENAFTMSSKEATCGHTFYVEGSIGKPCEGDYCEDKSEACISCANAALKECQGISGTRKVCAKLKFGGTINYSDGRFPEEVYLIMVCGFAQGDTVEITEANIDDIYEVELEKIAHIEGTAKTAADVNGQATYMFDLRSTELTQAANACEGEGNSFRGALLGVQYNDDTKIGERFVKAIATQESARVNDDMAIISKGNCGGGARVFDGYSSGKLLDKKDLARAIQCGFKKVRLQNIQRDYWSLDELLKAASGDKPITCNFNLSDANAPSNPGEKTPFCPADPNGIWRADYSPGAVRERTPSETCVEGRPCPSGGKCTTTDGKTCTCPTPTFIPGAGPAETPTWSC